MNLGYIDYINCYPFYQDMFRNRPVEGVEVAKGPPSFLNDQMKKGKLDMGPVSAALYPELQKDILVLPRFCLSSVGYVRSVMLYSRVPIGELDGKTVGLTTASYTSVVLLKILLSSYFQVRPEYIRTDDTETDAADALLLIGNQALVKTKRSFAYQYDVGEMWLRETGRPVVFALFVVRKEAIANNEQLVRKVIESYALSLANFQKDRGRTIQHAREMYPDIEYDLYDYYNVLQFQFTESLKKALLFFYQEAARLELLQQVTAIQYY